MSQYESGVATAGGDKAKPKCNGKELGNSDNFTGKGLKSSLFG